MKRYSAFFSSAFLLLLAAAGPLFPAEQSVHVTADQAQRLGNNTQVVLRGNIIFGLGGDRYLLRDSSGDMVIKVEDDKWDGLFVGPFDRIEVSGELKRDDRIWHM